MGSARRVGLNEIISTYGAVGFGRDYTSLSLWESDTDIDLVTDQSSRVLECYDDAVFDDNVIIASAITSASYFRTIRPAPGNFHNGTPSTGIRFSIASLLVSQVFFLSEDYSSIQDLSITFSSASTSGRFAILCGGNATETSVIGCMAHDCANSLTGSAHGIIVSGAVGNAYIIDCLSINNKSDGFLQNGGDMISYNNTAVGNGNDGFRELAGIGVAKNCLASANTNLDFEGGWTSSTNNASSDATAPGTGSRINQTFTFINAAGDDYHLDPSDTGALGFGADLSADAIFAFDDDIDKQVPSTWSIGFDSLVISITSGIRNFLMRRRRRNRRK